MQVCLSNMSHPAVFIIPYSSSGRLHYLVLHTKYLTWQAFLFLLFFSIPFIYHGGLPYPIISPGRLPYPMYLHRHASLSHVSHLAGFPIPCISPGRLPYPMHLPWQASFCFFHPIYLTWWASLSHCLTWQASLFHAYPLAGFPTPCISPGRLPYPLYLTWQASLSQPLSGRPAHSMPGSTQPLG